MTKWSQRTIGLISVLLFAVIATALNLLVFDKHVRLDLTRDKRFSVSPELQSLLDKIEDSITITIYVSPELPPQLLAPRQSAEDLLREVATAANGKLKLRVVELTEAKKKELAEELTKYSVTPLQAQMASREGLTVRTVYFHMLMQYRDRSQVLPIPELSNFEYVFARALLKLSQEERPLVTAIDTETASEFLRLMSTLKKGGLDNLVEVELVDASQGRALYIPERTKLVVISAREPLTPRNMWELDQFLMYGGKLLVLANGTAYDDPMIFFKAENLLPNINQFLAHYGVKIGTELVEDWGSNLETPAKIDEKNGQPVYSMDPFPFPILPIIKGENIEDHIPAMTMTQRLLMPYATRVVMEPRKNGKYQVDTLMWTTNMADAQTTGPYNIEQPKPGTKPPKDLERIPVAASISGPFVSYYGMSSGPRRESDPVADPVQSMRLHQAANRPSIPQSLPGAEIVVLGSAHMFWQNFLNSLNTVDPSLAAENVNFLQNLIEGLTIGDELAKVRSKQMRQAFLDGAKVEESKSRMQALGTFAVPALLMILGALWAAARRARLASLARKYAK
jgi:ABC-2 type transport system permease protein